MDRSMSMTDASPSRGSFLLIPLSTRATDDARDSVLTTIAASGALRRRRIGSGTLVLVTLAGLAAGMLWSRGLQRTARERGDGKHAPRPSANDDAVDDARVATGGGVPSATARAGRRERMHTQGSGAGAADAVASPDRGIGATAEAVGPGTEPATPTGGATASVAASEGEALTTEGRPIVRPAETG